jgi:hypothetical protein
LDDNPEMGGGANSLPDDFDHGKFFEGLEPRAGWLRGGPADTALTIREHGWRLRLDVAEGHKTGFYLDQRDNRAHFARWVRHFGCRQVLNAYCYTGGFTVAALAGGAEHVTSVDSSAPALERVQAHVQLNGFGLRDLGGSTTPFPIPQSGLEAIWNHLVRYVGGGTERIGHSFPVRSNGDYFKIGFRSQRIYAQNMQDPEPNRLFYALGYFTEPATLRGTIFLVHEPVDQVAEQRSAWIYNAGARRVRRDPDLAYDGVNDGSEGMVVTDQVDGYNGAPDRFEWKLVGKREMYIPYNNYKLSDK